MIEFHCEPGGWICVPHANEPVPLTKFGAAIELPLPRLVAIWKLPPEIAVWQDTSISLPSEALCGVPVHVAAEAVAAETTSVNSPAVQMSATNLVRIVVGPFSRYAR
jgi:hypothetical protein